MKSLHKFILVLFLGLACQHTYSQKYQFRTSGLSVLEKKENGKWGIWSDLTLANLSVVLDTDRNRIVVYSEMIQWFDIAEYIETEENDTDIVYSFMCSDKEGLSCKISIITRKLQYNRKQLYINYDDHIIMYNIFNM